VYIDTNTNADNIGVDIEFPRPNILKLANKFISSNDIDPEENAELALLVWSSKEVLYKIYAEKALDFKTHLSVQNHNQLIGKIHNETTQKTVVLAHEYIDNKLLVWSL
jgi:phosphopantetheinyl transferase